MTHIVTDGKYLIADKRYGFTTDSDTEGTGAKNTVPSQFYSDDAVKIRIPTGSIVVNRERENNETNRITALSIAGVFSLGLGHPFQLLTRLGCFCEYADYLNENVFTSTNFTIVAAVENGSVCILIKTENSRGNSEWQVRRVSPKQFSHGRLEIHGSGSDNYGDLVRDAYAKNEITLLDVFLYGSYLDKQSSTDYSVFGFRENHLYTAVSADEETVRTAFNKVSALFKFEGAKKIYLPFY